MSENLCQECGLPLSVCSALASYRKMAEELDRGRIDEAKRYAETAREYHDKFENSR